MSAYASSEHVLAPPITLVPRRGRAADARQDNVSSIGVVSDPTARSADSPTRLSIASPMPSLRG
jgi:hypothetical protein